MENAAANLEDTSLITVAKNVLISVSLAFLPSDTVLLATKMFSFTIAPAPVPVATLTIPSMTVVYAMITVSTATLPIPASHVYQDSIGFWLIMYANANWGTSKIP